MAEEGKSRISAPIVILIECALALILAIYLLHKYGNLRRQNPLATGSTLVVWFLSFVIIVLLPVDVSSSFYQHCLARTNNTLSDEELQDNCSGFVCVSPPPDYLVNLSGNCYSCFQPYSFVCPFPLTVLWYIIYWLFFVLSWIVLPLFQSYVLASYFSIWKKVLRALIENLIIYITFLVIFLLLFIYLLAEKIISLENLPSLLATASNTWGLLILTLLLGYGLVEVPRSLFNASRRNYSLKHCYFKAAKLYTDMAEVEEKLQEVIERVKKVSHTLHYNDPLRKYLDVVIKKFPSEMQTEFGKGRDDFEDYRHDSGEDALSKSSLESLLKSSMKSVRRSNSSRIHWLELTDQALHLEDIERNASSGQRFFQSSLRPHRDTWVDRWLPHLEWYWKLLIAPWAYRIMAAGFALLSVTILWSEVTFSIAQGKVRLSFFAILIYASHSYSNYILVEFISICVVAYMSICAYFTVFRIRIFNLYYLAPRHSTDEYSLLFSAVLLSRLALPICLNYLYMIEAVRLTYHEEDDTPQTAFAMATGTTDLIPWLNSYFNIYYPALMILVCIATFFSIGSRLASIIGYQKFIGEDDFSADYIDEGKALMKRERRIRERNLREHGKAMPDNKHPFDALREGRVSRVHRPTEATSRVSEDESRLARFVNKAKSLATKSKVAVTTKYNNVRGRDEDGMELLPSARGSDPDVEFPTRAVRHVEREPAKDLFDDV